MNALGTRPFQAWGAVRALAALLSAIPGVLTLAGAFDRHEPWNGALALNSPPGSPLSFLHLLALAAGIGLLALSHGLFQGKRRALDLAVAVLCAVALVRIARELGDAGTIVVLCLAATLALTRNAFARGSASRPSVVAGTVALAAFAVAYMLSTAAMLATDQVRSLGGALAADAAGRTATGALNPSEPLGFVLDALVVLGLLAAARFGHGLLRPARTADGHAPAEHGRAAAIVARHGADSLDPFALREDKAFHFAHGGVLAYRTLRETAVVAGDPIGPPGSAPEILRSFRERATRDGWDVVVTGASARNLDAYLGCGMRALHIGNEAVVDPVRFSLEGRAIRKVRQSVNRIARHGWTIEVVPDAGLSAEAVGELERIESVWRSARPRIQGFAMTLGRMWAADDDVGGIYVLARDVTGELRAFVRFLQYDGGLSLDVMRRLGGEPNGLNEALVVAALQYAGERGIREVSLNFAGFAHVMAAKAALSRSQRLLRFALKRAHGRFQLERLVRFNDKFAPEWRPRYLVYGRRTHLPLAALRVLQAEAYLRPPRTHPLSQRWTAPEAPLPAGAQSAAVSLASP